MTIWYLFPLTVGLCIVTQGILNKQFSLSYGMATASFINAMVFAIAAFLLLVASQKWPLAFPEFVSPKLGQYEFQPWHLIPGLCGFIIVLFTPWSIQYLGAAQVFVLIVCSQLLFSSLWDILANSITFSVMKIVGLILVAIGATLFSLAR